VDWRRHLILLAQRWATLSPRCEGIFESCVVKLDCFFFAAQDGWWRFNNIYLRNCAAYLMPVLVYASSDTRMVFAKQRCVDEQPLAPTLTGYAPANVQPDNLCCCFSSRGVVLDLRVMCI